MGQNKINILHLVLSLEIGGMERFVYEHCVEADRELFNVSVCCIDRLGGFHDSLILNGTKVDLLQKNQKHFDYLFFYKLSKYLIKNKIEVLHIHSGAFFHGSIASFLAKTPCSVYTEHGRHIVEPLALYVLDKISSIFIDQIVTVSPDLEAHLIEKINLPARKIKTIINGVNVEKFQPRQKPKNLIDEFGIEAGCKIIGTVGRLADIKDQFTLIRAFAEIRKIFTNSKLILVGEGPCELDLRRLVDDLFLSGSVIFTGSRNDIPEILNLLDVFVLSSLREGTSLSLLEAMASGVPPVVTNVGGNPNIVRDYYNGYLFCAGDEKQLVRKVIQILDCHESFESFKKNARDTILNKFSMENNIESYRDIYLNIIKKKQAKKHKICIKNLS